MSEDRDQADAGAAESARKTSTALDDLTAAARRADQTFTTGIITNLPTTISGVVDQFGQLGQALGEFTRVAEARAQTLRQFSDIGLNFNSNIRTMSQTAINARMNLEQMAIFAGKNSEALATLGTGVDSGLTTFTRQLNDLLNGQSKDIERNLGRLGFETDEIIETFMSYEQQLAFAGVTSRRSERERNLAAQEYAQTLDELATLTGRQRDELDKEMREVAGRGELMLTARDLPEAMRPELANMVGEFTATQGRTMGLLLQDVLTNAVPDREGNDLLLALPEMADTMEEMRRALRDPTTTREELQGMLRILNAEAATLVDSELAVTLGRFRDLDTPFARVAEEQREAAQIQLNRLRQGTEGGTAEEGAAARDRQYQERLDSALTDTRTVYNTFIDSQIELERARNQARQQEFDLVYGTLEGQIVRFGDDIVGAARRVNENITTDLQGVSDWLQQQVAGLGSTFTAQINRAINDISGVNTEQAAALEAELSGAAERFAEASPTDRPAIQAEIEDIIDRINNEVRRARLNDLDSADFTITNADITILNRTPIPEEDDGQSIGTLGTAGRLFRNFGTESLVPLHNIEAVLTPRQMGDVVQNSAGGLARAILGNINSIQTDKTVDAILSSGIVGQDQLSVMQGNLNSIMRSVRETMTANTNTTIDTTSLESEIRQISIRMRGPLEEALTSSLRPHLEQLVAHSKNTADSNERIQRNTKYMTGNV